MSIESIIALSVLAVLALLVWLILLPALTTSGLKNWKAEKRKINVVHYLNKSGNLAHESPDKFRIDNVWGESGNRWWIVSFDTRVTVNCLNARLFTDGEQRWYGLSQSGDDICMTDSSNRSIRRKGPLHLAFRFFLIAASRYKNCDEFEQRNDR